MKPNDEAYKAAILAIKENGPYYAGSKIRESMAKHLAEVALPAAYAAQFKSKDYAGLVKQLRFIDEDTLNIEPYSCEQLCKSAADALEAVLADRDALKSEAERLQRKLSEADDTIRGLCTAGESYRDELDKLARRFALLLYGGRQEATAAILKQVEAERDALAARLAPVDDDSRHLTTEEQKVFNSALRRSAKIK